MFMAKQILHYCIIIKIDNSISFSIIIRWKVFSFLYSSIHSNDKVSS